MVIIETSVFTRQVRLLLSDEEYRRLQAALVARPSLGVLIKGSGGLRKARWAPAHKGKSGSVRVIYYWAITRDQILMLLIYSKTERDDLTLAQLKVLRGIVKQEYP